MKIPILINTIIESGILDNYESQDGELRTLVDRIRKLPDEWEKFSEVVVSNKSAQAKEIGETYKQRLLAPPMQEAKYFDLRKSNERLVEYCINNLQSRITTVLFNCPNTSYHVFCGFQNEKVDVICVITGKHIAESYLKQ